MANVNSPFGLRPVRHMLGLPWNGSVKPYFIPSSYATALFIGDPVVKTGTANTARVFAPGLGEFGIGTLPEINKSAAGAAGLVTGAIVGFGALPNNLALVHNPASTERIAFVCDDPWTVFEVQADGAVPATSIGLNANLIFTQSGSAITGLSGVELDTSAPAVTATFQLNILRAVNRVDNDTTLTRANVEVRIIHHTEGMGITVSATDGQIGV
jgi:hypothetical protein